MGDASITFLLDNIADLVKYHVFLISDASVELRRLTDELTQMRAILEDAWKNRYKEEHFKVWERNLRSTVFEVEDAIDTCITEAAIAKKGNWLTKYFKGKPKTLAQRIKSLREGDVKAVLDASTIFKARLRLVSEFAPIEETETFRNNKLPRQDDVVGFEDEIEKLIGYLLEPSVGLDVVTIVGMPGLGKTTVAWQISQHPRIEYEFRTLIWVVVSQEFDKREVLLTILKKFRNTEVFPTDHLSLADLENMVKECLQRGEFLLFLDDVWTVEVWKEISSFLPKDNEYGRVMITTRNEKVGWHANPKRDPHKLRFLTNEESTRLLRIEVFNSREGFPPTLPKYGKIIAKKCHGLPLAIIVIAGILFDKLSQEGGEARRKEAWESLSGNTGICIFKEDKNNLMKNVISLSYYTLPTNLRYCFLYLAMFPENSEISVWELTKLWIAEGFIIPLLNGKNLEATADDYLEDLINRNLVRVDKVNPFGKAKTCRIHETIRQFCKNEAGYEEQNLFQEVKKGDDGTFAYNENQECRRLIVHSYVKDFFLKKFKETKLPKPRSFLSFTKPIDLEPKEIPAFTEVFELLRVFNAKTINFPNFPIKFTKLVHLRYLTLSGKDLKSLPSSITKLWNLQTLMVDTESSTLEIEANIWLMMHLRHVKTKASIVLTCKDAGGEGGDTLQTLDKLSPESCTKEVFKRAKNLRTLGIRGDISKLDCSRCLEELYRLEKLKLVNYANYVLASENPLNFLPRVCPIMTLKSLTLSNTYLKWTHMSTVGNICTLEVLKLKDNAFRGDCWESVAGGFLSLEYLYIIRSEDIMFWRILGDGDPFPSLKTVVIKNCEKLETVPKDLMRKLDRLELHRVTAFAVKSAMEVEQESRRGQFKLIVSHGDAQI